MGMVTDATDTTARLELQTNCKTITVDLAKLRVVEYACESGLPIDNLGSSNEGTSGGSGLRGLGDNSIHSGYGNATPSINAGNRTPAYNAGNATPAYGAQTPRYDTGLRHCCLPTLLRHVLGRPGPDASGDAARRPLVARQVCCTRVNAAPHVALQLGIHAGRLPRPLALRARQSRRALKLTPRSRTWARRRQRRTRPDPPCTRVGVRRTPHAVTLAATPHPAAPTPGSDWQEPGTPNEEVYRSPFSGTPSSFMGTPGPYGTPGPQSPFATEESPCRAAGASPSPLRRLVAGAWRCCAELRRPHGAGCGAAARRHGPRRARLCA